MTLLKNFSIILVILAVIDFIWLGLVMKGFYQKELAPIGRFVNGSFQPNILAAVLTYILIALGITIFIIPKIQGLGLIETFGWGALLGLIIYGVYDLTNFSILAAWTIKITLVDIAWGSFLGGILAVIARSIGLRP